MRNLWFLIPLLLVLPVWIAGCDFATEPQFDADSAIVEDGTEAKWVEFDSDAWPKTSVVYLACLDETVVIQGTINWSYTYNYPNGDRFNAQRNECWWSPEDTTMEGPSGTWTIVSQDCRARYREPDFRLRHRITWESKNTGARMQYREERVNFDPTTYSCKLLGKHGR